MLALSLLFFLAGLLSFSLAQVNLLAGVPLLQGATSYTFLVSTTTKTKPTSCYIKSGIVSQCRRKRGIVERPQLIQFDDFIISPSAVFGIETTAVPDTSDSRFDSNSLSSSFNDEMEYLNSQSLFRQLIANGRNNLLTVGNCGQTILDISQMLECLGLSVQDTTTLTATFTETKTTSKGFTTFTVAGCTPAGFPYPTCPPGSTSSTNLLGGLVGTVTNVIDSLLPSSIASIVNPILTNVVPTLPLPGQGVLPGQGSTGGLLPGGTGNIPVVGGLLPGQGSTAGLGGLLPGGTGNIPVVGGLLPGQGSTAGLGGLLPGGTGNIPVVGGLLPGQGSTGGLLGGLLPGTSNLPLVGGLLSGQGGTTGSLPIVGGLLPGGQGSTSSGGGLGGLLPGLGGLPLTGLGGLPLGGVLGDGSQPVPLAYRYSYA